MHLREEILKEHSKAQCDKIVAWVGDNQQKFDELFSLFINDEYRVVQRVSWPLSYCAIAHPHLIKNQLGLLVKNLQKQNLHNAVKRNSVRLLQAIRISKKYQGMVMDTCFKFIASPFEPVAVKAFSLTILGNLSKEYPEIIPEIKWLIEGQLPSQTAAFKSRAKRLLTQFEKLQG